MKIEKGKRTRGIYSHDARVTPSCGTLELRFRQSSYEKITNSGYIELSLENDWLYMKPSDSIEDYRVSIEKPTINGKLRGVIHSCNRELYIWALKNRGIYNIISLGNNLYTLKRV